MNKRIYNKEISIPPENRAFLERPRINEIFKEAMRKPLIIVSAGAGYGKTLAVYSFLQTCDAPAMWFQLSERDNRRSRFWENFARTTALYDERLAERLLAIEFPDTDDKFEKYISLIEENVSEGGERVRVFDDLHLIQEKSVLRFIEKLIKFPFPNVTNILISRTDPELNVVRLLSEGMIFTVDENDLRFTENEIARYFQTHGISLSQQSISNIYDDTRGWVFAVNLLSLSLKKNPLQEQSARVAMKLNIFKMIENEVFAVSSQRLQRLLIQLSLIEHLSAELVSILAADDETLVDELRRISSFVRLDIYLHAYFIHHLFLDYLRQRQNILTENEKKEVYSKTAVWCDENGYKMDAVSYYDKAGEYGKLVDTVNHIRIQFPFDQAKFILEIYEKTPRCLLERWVHYHRQYPILLLSVDMYEEAFADIMERIEKYSAMPNSDFNSQILRDAHLLLAITKYLMSPRTDRYDYYDDCAKAERCNKLSPYRESGSLNSVNLSAMASKVGTTRSGAMEEYIGSLTRCVPLISNIWNGCTYGLDDLAAGELSFYKADLNDAAKILNQALYKAEERNQYEVRNRALFYLLRIALANGDFAKIQSVLKNLEAQLDMKEYHTRFTTFDIVSGWYYSVINQPNMIARWILSGDFGKDSIGTFKAAFGNFAKAKFYYSDRRYNELISFIESEPSFNNVLFGRLETKLLMAASLYQIKERGAAMTAFREAYELASSNDLTMPFIELGKDLHTLARAAARDRDAGIPEEWLELVSRKSSTYAKRLILVTAEYKKANNIKDDVRLSQREREVLQDLYDGLSRAEIAANRGLSLSSVKMTLNMVYSKLGANSLADVVRIAADRNLTKSGYL